MTYIVSSTSSSVTPYFEMWDFGSSDTNSATSMAMPLYVPTSAEILNNTISSSRLALVTDSHWSTCSFESAFDNSYHFQRSTSYKYYIEIDYTVKLDDSADVADSMVVRINDTGNNNSGAGGSNYNGFLAAGATSSDQKVVNFTTYEKFTVGGGHSLSSVNPHYGYGGSNIQPQTTNTAYEAYAAGSYMNFKAAWTFTPNTLAANPSPAVAPSLLSLVNSSLSGWPSSSADSLQFHYGTTGTIYNPVTIMHRKVKVTQLA